MPSTRKQKAKKKRSRQSDVLSDIENLDVMLGNYRENEQFGEGDVTEREIELESERRLRDTIPVESIYRSLLNTNLSKNSELTVETNRTINSEITSQMSRKLDKMKSDLNSHILEAKNSAIESKIIPNIRSVVESQNSAENLNSDLRSDGPHLNTSNKLHPQSDLRSNGRCRSLPPAMATATRLSLTR